MKEIQAATTAVFVGKKASGHAQAIDSPTFQQFLQGYTWSAESNSPQGESEVDDALFSETESESTLERGMIDEFVPDEGQAAFSEVPVAPPVVENQPPLQLLESPLTAQQSMNFAAQWTEPEARTEEEWLLRGNATPVTESLISSRLAGPLEQPASEQWNENTPSLVAGQQSQAGQTFLEGQAERGHSIEESNNQSLAKTAPKEVKQVETSTVLPKESPVTMAEKINVSPEPLAANAVQATMTFPSTVIEKMEHGKSEAVPMAVIEKISQPLVEKVTTMNTFDTQKITVALLPEKLGKMEVTIQVTNQKVQLEFLVESSQTRQMLETITTKFEQVLNKQAFPPQLSQEKVTPATPLASPLQNEMGFFNQSAFQQSFQQERQQATFSGKTGPQKTFADLTTEKMENLPSKGSVDLLV